MKRLHWTQTPEGRARQRRRVLRMQRQGKFLGRRKPKGFLPDPHTVKEIRALEEVIDRAADGPPLRQLAGEEIAGSLAMALGDALTAPTKADVFAAIRAALTLTTQLRRALHATTDREPAVDSPD